MLADHRARRAARRQAVGQLGLVDGAVEHRPQVVGHPAVDRHEPRGAVRQHGFTRLDGVERHARVRDERAARLDRRARAPRRAGSCAADDRGDVGLRRTAGGRRRCRRPRGRRRGRSRRDRAQRRERPRARNGVEVEQLGAEVDVQAAQVEVRRARRTRSAPGRRRSEAELGLGVAGEDRGRGCRRRRPGVTRSSTAGGRPASAPGASSSSRRCRRRSCRRRRSTAAASSRSRLRVPVQDDAPGLEAGAAGRCAARRRRRRRAPGPPRRTPAAPRCTGNALDAKMSSPPGRVARRTRRVNARALGAQVVLGHDVGRRAELGARARRASQPPMVRRPSRTSEAWGYTAAAIGRALWPIGRAAGPADCTRR